MHRLRSPSSKDKSCLFQRTMAEWPGMEKTVLRHIALVKKAISNVLILEIKGYLLILTTVLISHVDLDSDDCRYTGFSNFTENQKFKCRTA